MKYRFTNIIGSFVFDENFKVVDKTLFKNLGDYNKTVNKLEAKQLRKILSYFKDNYHKEFYQRNLELTKQSIKDSVNNDSLIIQSINAIGELDKVKNTLVKRLREWYELYYPELSKKIEDHEKFVSKIAEKRTSEMGADLSEEDLSEIMNLAKTCEHLFSLRKKYESYLEKLTKETCPNVMEVAGSLIAAKLIDHTGSLKKLARFPASTIQILGAEKALFRHMKSKRHKPPKYGILHEHYLITQAKKNMHGKVARALADKIAIAAKVDYFKGDFVGDKLKKELEEKFK